MGQIALRLEQLCKTFGKTAAASNITLDIEEGQFVSLLGPSGCGKTTTLRMIGGFAKPDSGRILLFGEDITDRPAHLRDIGMVFQDYALWPHMTVLQHMTFGLKLARCPADEMKRRIDRAMSLVRLEGLEKRYPAQLSGGQQQRVALARALVMEPKVLLLDEPLSNLDRKLRDAMKMELRRLQGILGITMVFVTHDQEEALALSDRIVVMNEGNVVQSGTSRDVYEQPSTAFVAGFVGNANFLPCTVREVSGGCAAVELAQGQRLNVPLDDSASWKPGEQAVVFARPEAIGMESGRRAEDGVLHATFVSAVYEGGVSKALVALEGTDQEIMVEIRSGSLAFDPQATYSLTLDRPRLLAREVEA